MPSYYDAYQVYAKQKKRADELDRLKEEKKQLVEDRKTWPLSKMIGKSACLTIWGAALEISSLVQHEKGSEAKEGGVDEKEALREDAYELRFPQIQSAIASGVLRAINADTFQASKDLERHFDLVLREDFNEWLEHEYSYMFKTKKNRRLTSKERSTITTLIRCMQRLTKSDDRVSLGGVDLLDCFESLILNHYGGVLPEHKKFKNDMHLVGYTDISSTTITKYFNKIDC